MNQGSVGDVKELVERAQHHTGEPKGDAGRIAEMLVEFLKAREEDDRDTMLVSADGLMEQGVEFDDDLFDDGVLGTLTVDDVMTFLDRLLDGVGVEAIWFNSKTGESVSSGFDDEDFGGMSRPSMEYVNTGDLYVGTVIYDHDEGEFTVSGLGDWMKAKERAWRKEIVEGQITVELDNGNPEHVENRTTTAYIRGPRACAQARHDREITGSNWQCVIEDEGEGQVAQAGIADHAGLVEELEAAGYDVDTSEYWPPGEGQAHMQPTYVEGDMAVGEALDETIIVPWEYAEEFEWDEPPEKMSGIWVELSAPWYMDSTGWEGSFDSIEEARAYVVETWEIHPVTGQPRED